VIEMLLAAGTIDEVLLPPCNGGIVPPFMGMPL